MVGGPGWRPPLRVRQEGDPPPYEEMPEQIFPQAQAFAADEIWVTQEMLLMQIAPLTEAVQDLQIRDFGKQNILQALQNLSLENAGKVEELRTNFSLELHHMPEELMYAASLGFEEFFEKNILSDDYESRELRLLRERLYPDLERQILHELHRDYFPMLESRVMAVLPPQQNFSDEFKRNLDILSQRILMIENVVSKEFH